jgi:hypothetical protein
MEVMGALSEAGFAKVALVAEIPGQRTPGRPARPAARPAAPQSPAR